MGVYLRCLSAASRAGCRNRKPGRPVAAQAVQPSRHDLVTHRERVRAHRPGDLMSATSTRALGEVSTLVPARLERLPWGRFHVLVVAALGITWILDGLEVTLAGSVAGALKESPALHFSDAEVGARRQRLSHRRGRRRAVLRLADRPARPQEALLHHHRRLSRRHRDDRASPGTASPSSFPLSHRRRHRRRIRGDQLDDPGAGSGALSRPHSIS